jgi:hypothetical protein
METTSKNSVDPSIADFACLQLKQDLLLRFFCIGVLYWLVSSPGVHAGLVGYMF